MYCRQSMACWCTPIPCALQVASNQVIIITALQYTSEYWLVAQKSHTWLVTCALGVKRKNAQLSENVPYRWPHAQMCKLRELITHARTNFRIILTVHDGRYMFNVLKILQAGQCRTGNVQVHWDNFVTADVCELICLRQVLEPQSRFSGLGNSTFGVYFH